ncbi:MAG: hypothetical protein LC791_18540, partial [Acidobacteria bacterium]|nr:hypothetical protein [Acidobacteriota bacterium]
MALQTGAVSLLALGAQGHPTLRDGVHLRWNVDASRGFPPFGFDVFRRRHRHGTPVSLDFTGETPRVLPKLTTFGDTTWHTERYAPELDRVQIAPGTRTVFRPMGSAVDCRFDRTKGLVRRVELDITQWEVTQPNEPAKQLTIWGIAGDERVSSGSITIDHTSHRQVITVAVQGDALEGIQLWSGRYGILAMRWVFVADEADVGWGKPLNPMRIGFPVTAPGYRVRHAHSPDLGNGAQDWLEASDRMRLGLESSAGGLTPLLPPELALRFGPPRFADLRELMRKSLG